MRQNGSICNNGTGLKKHARMRIDGEGEGGYAKSIGNAERNSPKFVI
jgi:hypothetical protein